MSKIYEALKKAEREKREKTADFSEVPREPAPQPKVEAVKETFTAVPDVLFEKGVEKAGMAPFAVTLSEPHSPVAEQFRKVGVKLMHQGRPDQRTVLITSPLPQDGKTLTAVNVAIGLAQLPETAVVLIDADMRKPDAHKWLRVSPRPGLTHYLKDGVNVADICRSTPVPALKIITAGEQHSRPTEILSEAKFRHLIDELRNRWPGCFVVIDTPPVLLSTEPEILMQHVDHVIVVVKYGKTPRSSLSQTLNQLDKKKVIGVIFDQVDAGTMVSRYGHYNYGYYYPTDKKKRK